MDISSKVNIHNKFDIVVKDAKTGEQKERYETYNIVKDYCYDRILRYPSDLWRYIAYGSGTGTPDPTTRTLLNFLGSVSARRDSLTYGIPTTIAVYTGRIAANQAVGQLITEIGLASDSYSNAILTHALIKDSAGNPIAIQKTDQDIIDIYATVYFNLEDLSATYGDNVRWVDPEYNAIIKRLLGSSFSHRTYLYRDVAGHDDIFYFGREISSTSEVSTDVENKKMLLPAVRFDESTANGAIKGIRVLNAVDIKFPVQNIWNGFQFDNIDVATGDGSTVDFSLPWDNIRPGTLQVFVDGAQVTPVEIHEDKFSVPVMAADILRNLPRMSSMSWQQNGNYVAIGTIDNKLRIYKISSTGRITMTDSIQYTDKHVIGVDFTSDFKTLVVATSDGAFTIYDFDPVAGTIGSQSYTAGAAASQLTSSAMAKLNNLRVVPGDKVVILYSNNDFVTGNKFATVSLDTTLKRYGDLVQFANINFNKNCDISPDGRTLLVSTSGYPLIINFDPETGTVGTSRTLDHVGYGYNMCVIHPQKLGAAYVTTTGDDSTVTSYLKFGALDENLNPSGSVFYSTSAGDGIDYLYLRDAKFSPDGTLIAVGKYYTEIMIHEVDFATRSANFLGKQYVLPNNMSIMPNTKVLRWPTNDVIVAYVQGDDVNDASFYSYKIVRGPKYHFKLPTPPAPGAKITASFAVDYIPKTSDYVLDISASVQLM